MELDSLGTVGNVIVAFSVAVPVSLVLTMLMIWRIRK
jgi:hypothetical protein